MVTVFLSIFEPNGFPFGLENLKENCHHDHIPFNVKGNGNKVFSRDITACAADGYIVVYMDGYIVVLSHFVVVLSCSYPFCCSRLLLGIFSGELVLHLTK